MQQIVTRQEAKAAGLTLYFTGIPCIHGHLAPRLVMKQQMLGRGAG
jgi:hypothetical protein